MSEPDKNSNNNLDTQVDKNTVKVEPGTLVLIIVALLLIPLLISGFLFQ